MRNQGFTLIELMIVIAIIAIIAAIAIPNLLESRVTSQEAAAATALKSGLLPAQVQFQAGGYNDFDGNGVGTYAVNGVQSSAPAVVNPFNLLSGQALAKGGITLNLLAPSYAVTGAYVAGVLPGEYPSVSGYKFKVPLSDVAPVLATPTDGNAEKTWGVISYPSDDQQGRRFFGINQAGNIYSSKPDAAASTSATVGTGGAATACTDMFGAGLISAPASATYLPYRK